MDNSLWQEDAPLEVFYPGRIAPEMHPETGSSTGSSTQTTQMGQGRSSSALVLAEQERGTQL